MNWLPSQPWPPTWSARALFTTVYIHLRTQYSLSCIIHCLLLPFNGSSSRVQLQPVGCGNPGKLCQGHKRCNSGRPKGGSQLTSRQRPAHEGPGVGPSISNVAPCLCFPISALRLPVLEGWGNQCCWPGLLPSCRGAGPVQNPGHMH